MGKTLHLHLKKQWYDMIASGEKKEEYRECKLYYFSKFLFGKLYDEVIFYLGYPKSDDTERTMVFEVKNISIGHGNPKWGAPADKEVFIISLGKRIR